MTSARCSVSKAAWRRTSSEVSRLRSFLQHEAGWDVVASGFLREDWVLCMTEVRLAVDSVGEREKYSGDAIPVKPPPTPFNHKEKKLISEIVPQICTQVKRETELVTAS